MKKPESEKSEPLVSICCTTYNLENYIRQTLDSFLMQKTDFPFEIIIHDDASTDRTPEIIREYAGIHPDLIQPIFQEENQYTKEDMGLGGIFARHLFPAAGGTFIAMCDGDDYWTNQDKLQTQLDYLTEHNDLVACFTNATVLHENDQSRKLFHTNLEEGIVPMKKIMLSGGAVYPSSALVFRKNELLASPVYQNIYSYAADIRIDTLLIYTLGVRGQIGFINRPMAVYRRWDGGLFSSIIENREKIAQMKAGDVKGFKKMLEYINEEHKPLLKRKISSESLYIARYGKNVNRFEYIKNLHYKEMVKLVTGYK